MWRLGPVPSQHSVTGLGPDPGQHYGRDLSQANTLWQGPVPGQHIEGTCPQPTQCSVRTCPYTIVCQSCYLSLVNTMERALSLANTKEGVISYEILARDLLSGCCLLQYSRFLTSTCQVIIFPIWLLLKGDNSLVFLGRINKTLSS